MLLKAFGHINQVPAAEWDRHHDGSFYFRHAFLKILQDTEVEQAQYRFLLFSNKGKPAGLAILSSFSIHLDLLSGEPWPLRMIKKVRPALFQLPVVFVGTPGSFGQPPYIVLDGQYHQAVQEYLLREQTKWAKELDVKLKIWKELPEAYPNRLLGDSGFLSFPSLPDMQLQTNFLSPLDYLARMRSNYSRKLHKTHIEWVERRGFYLSPFRSEDVASFFEGYRAVIQRTPVKLEIYKHRFFEALTSSDLNPELLVVERNDKKIMALLIEEKEVLNLILVSKPEKRYTDNLYSKLLHGVAFLATERGKSLLRLGQTSDYSKAALGSTPQPLRIYIRHDRPYVQSLLGKFGHLLFPDTPDIRLNVFKKEVNNTLVKPKRLAS